MQMLYCPNCNKATGYKRALGFGTLFMVVVTCGLWLLVIPIMPKRCSICGLTKSAGSEDRIERENNPFFGFIQEHPVIVILALLFIVSRCSH